MSNAPIDLATIATWEKVAGEATQGEWRVQYDEETMTLEVTHGEGVFGEFICIMDAPFSGVSGQEELDANHIATFDPPTILRMVAWMESAQAREAATCEWMQQVGDETWKSECGHFVTFEDSSPTEDEMKFCPYCGKSLVAVTVKEYEESDAD